MPLLFFLTNATVQTHTHTHTYERRWSAGVSAVLRSFMWMDWKRCKRENKLWITHLKLSLFVKKKILSIFRFVFTCFLRAWCQHTQYHNKCCAMPFYRRRRCRLHRRCCRSHYALPYISTHHINFFSESKKPDTGSCSLVLSLPLPPSLSTFRGLSFSVYQNWYTPTQNILC